MEAQKFKDKQSNVKQRNTEKCQHTYFQIIPTSYNNNKNSMRLPQNKYIGQWNKVIG